MIEDPEGLCLLVCIFERLLLIGVVACLSINRLNTLEACLDLSSLLGRDEASNGGCLGGHVADLCVLDL